MTPHPPSEVFIFKKGPTTDSPRLYWIDSNHSITSQSYQLCLAAHSSLWLYFCLPLRRAYIHESRPITDSQGLNELKCHSRYAASPVCTFRLAPLRSLRRRHPQCSPSYTYVTTYTSCTQASMPCTRHILRVGGQLHHRKAHRPTRRVVHTKPARSRTDKAQPERAPATRERREDDTRTRPSKAGKGNNHGSASPQPHHRPSPHPVDTHHCTPLPTPPPDRVVVSLLPLASPPLPLLLRLRLPPAPRAREPYIYSLPRAVSLRQLGRSQPHRTVILYYRGPRSHGERLLHDPGAGARRTQRRRRRAVVAAIAPPGGGAAQGPALAAHAAGRPAPPAARRPVARRVHGRDRAPLGRLPRRQARPRRRRALLRRRVVRRRRPRRLAPGPVPALHSPGDEGDLGVKEGGDGGGGGEPGAVRFKDRAAVPAAGRAPRCRRQAQRLQRLPRPPLRAAQRQLPAPAHPRRRRLRGRLAHRQRGQHHRRRVHGVHRDAAEEDGGRGRGRRRGGDDQDARVPVRARGGGGGAGGGGARRGGRGRGRQQVRGRGRRREGQGGRAEGVGGRAPGRHRRAGVPAGRLPGRHCGGPEGAVGPLQPLNLHDHGRANDDGSWNLVACLLATRGGSVQVKQHCSTHNST